MRLSPRAAVTGSPSRGWLAAMTAILVVTAAAGVTAAWADVSRAATALGSSWYGSAPYDMPLDNSPPALTQVLAERQRPVLTGRQAAGPRRIYRDGSGRSGAIIGL